MVYNSTTLAGLAAAVEPLCGGEDGPSANSASLSPKDEPMKNPLSPPRGADARRSRVAPPSPAIQGRGKKDSSNTQFSASNQKEAPRADEKKAKAAQPSLDVSAREGEALALSLNQKSLYLIHRLDAEGSAAYNTRFVAELAADTDLKRLETAIIRVFARHSALRTRYSPGKDGGAPTQTVLSAKANPLGLRTVDAAEWSADRVRTYLQAEVGKRLDLEKGEVSRVVIAKRANGSAVWLWVVHHIAVDLWSFAILIDEVAQIYAEPSTTLLAPPQYVSLVPSLGAWSRGRRGEEVLSYWQGVLVPPLPVLDMPLDFVRPPKQSFKGAAFAFDVPPDVAIRLRALALAEGVTLHTLLLAAYSALLHRYSGQTDIVVGTPTAGRGQLERERCVGYFVNPIPLRLSLAGDPGFLDHLKRVHRAMMGGLGHADLPLTALVERLQLERDPSRPSVFQTVFVLQKPHLMGDDGLAFFFTDTPGVQLSAGGEGPRALRMRSLDLGQAHCTYDLALMMAESPDRLSASLQYNTELFTPATARRLTTHMATLLASIARAPATRVSRLSLMGDVERRQILEWNETETPFPGDKRLIQTLVEERARADPEHAAVEGPDGDILTYAEFNARANQLAHYLRFRGVGPGKLVVVLMERTPAFVVALLGVIKAGGAGIPIDPKYPPERIAHIFDVARTSSDLLLLTERAFLKRLPENHGCAVLVLDGDAETRLLAKGCKANPKPQPALNWDSVAFVIFTSGSTGKPKGVMLRHQGLLAYAFWHNRAYKITSKDRVPHLAAVAFDASQAETWPTLTAGATMVQISRDRRVLVDSTKFSEWLVEKKITFTFLPTVLLESFLELPTPEGSRLRAIYTGGDKLHRGPRPDAKYTVVNSYGPCENTIGCSYFEVRPDYKAPPFTVGRPCANNRILILDASMNLCPVGIRGEMHLGGKQLARGYLGRPDLTQERFVESPFHPGQRLYKTGDLARYLADGTIEFVGRKDTQVKIRGNRIELGEVEAGLLDCDGVSEACVVCRLAMAASAHGRRGKRLVAYVVPGDDGIDIRVVRSQVSRALPDFMVPSAIVVLDKLPLTPNAKIDRRALPEPKANDYLTSAGGRVAPRNQLEASLAKMVESVLELPQDSVGMGDNFFDLGGHSLSAARLVSLIESTLQASVPFSAMFEASSLGALAERIAVIRNNPSAAISIRETPVAVPLPRRSVSAPTSNKQNLRPADADGKGSSAASLTPRTPPLFRSTSLGPKSYKDSSISQWVEQRRRQGSATTGSKSPTPAPSLRTPGPSFRASVASRVSDDSNKAALNGSHMGSSFVAFSNSPLRDKRASGAALLASPDLPSGMPSPRLGPRPGAEPASVGSAQGSPAPVMVIPELAAGESIQTYNQQSLWFMHLLAPDSVAYTCTLAVYVTGSRDETFESRADGIRGALQALVDRHPSLRTTFADRAGVSIQKVQEKVEVDFRAVYREGKKGSMGDKGGTWNAGSAALGAAIRAEAHTPFDLEWGPVFRGRLFPLDRSSGSGAPEGSWGLLFLIAHHIVMDGWSMERVVLPGLRAELKRRKSGSATLAAAADSKQPHAPVYTASDHAMWQRSLVTSSEGERMWNYWKRRLAAPPALEFPTDHARPAHQSFEGATLRFEIKKSVAAGLTALAKRTRTTLFMVLLASYYVLISRYTSQSDVVVGTPMACRNKKESQETVANLVNPVAIRVSLSGKPTVLELLRRVRTRTVGAFMNQDFPFSLLVDRLQKFRDPSRNPIFQLLFALNHVGGAQSPSKEQGDVDRMVPVVVDQDTSPFDLQLIVDKESGDGGRMTASLQYSTRLFKKRTIKAMRGHLETLWDSMLAHPNANIGDLEMLTSDETPVLERWGRANESNGDGDNAPAPRVHEEFLKQCRQQPNALAVACDPGGGAPYRHVTYGGLQAMSARFRDTVVHQVTSRRAARQTTTPPTATQPIVAVVMRRGVEWVASLLGVLRAGAAYVPVDPEYPQGRIIHMLGDARADLVLCDNTTLAKARRAAQELPPEARPAVVDVGSPADSEGKAPSSTASGGDRKAGDLAYVIYTSGSTGRPKGVMVSHMGLASVAQSMRREYSITNTDRTTQIFGPGFDPVGLELWPFLSAGASIHVVPEAIKTDPPALVRWITNHRITHSQTPTPIAHGLMRERWPVSGLALRVLSGGGEKLTVAFTDGEARPFRFDNHYGPSECTIITTLYTVPRGFTGAPAIGRPIRGARCFVIDKSKNLVPIGVCGELCVAGAHLARGYLNLPEKTRSSFVKHKRYGLIYRTGDRVRWRQDGQLEFMGRLDRQVKIRGFRIELGEIEAALQTADEGIRMAAVVVRDRGNGNDCLVAYLVLANRSGKAAAADDEPAIVEPSGVDVNTIRAALKDALPDYMVPDAFVFMSKFPQTPNGKLDRKALPAPDWEAVADGARLTVYVDPSGAVEEKVAGVWRRCLSIARIGANDNFFDLGGHSLTASRVVVELREAFGVTLTVTDLFDSPTVRGVAARVQAMRGEGGSVLAAPGAQTAERLRRDVALDEGIQRGNLGPITGRQIRAPREVLLTGATGFLGAFLVAELLQATNATIHCVVRAKDSSAAARRVRKALDKYGLLKIVAPGDLARVRAHPGDLERPKLGLSAKSYDQIARHADWIVHCGAWVNSVLPYERLRKANVGGTVQVLKLATTHTLKLVHHVSTLSVFEGGDFAGRRIRESDAMPDAGAIHGGYPQTKWVADKLVIEAARRGVPAAIYRPGRITGHSRLGTGATEDFQCRLIKGCLQLGLYPDLDWYMDMTPVDFVASSIVQLALAYEPLADTKPHEHAHKHKEDHKRTAAEQHPPGCDCGLHEMGPSLLEMAAIRKKLRQEKKKQAKEGPVQESSSNGDHTDKKTPEQKKMGSRGAPIFHLCNPRPIDLAGLFKWLRGFGYPVEQAEYVAWRAELVALAKSRPQCAEGKSARTTSAPINALLPMLSLLHPEKAQMGDKKTMPLFDTRQTRERLGGVERKVGGEHTLSCPEITDELLDSYFAHFIAIGFLPPPQYDSAQFAMEY